MILWHGSKERIDRPDPAKTVDGGFHLGTEAQARMRNAAFLHEIEVDPVRVRRCKDQGGNWAGRIAAARGAGMDAIIYLNRYEGMTAARIEDLHTSGQLSRLDGLSDAAFRHLVPEAEDSYILLHASDMRLLRVIERTPRDEAPSP